ncbi:hypothetical protein [Blastopirellula marina]|uniref:RDD family protein n=1 Tax=Blastopirellula marina DSM 3645 TaxID=314230 RepID=A3ZQ21_9BACT|nr:hypothetical protein [Blastopirellula marina]EAQ81294.1 hypothetical protein DSM3645_22921 [Blastopirellula marina DSM 3645]
MSEPEPQNAFTSPADDSDLVQATPVYARPQTEDLPSRWLRLGAASLDLLILVALAIPISIFYALIGPIEIRVAPEKEFLVPMVMAR